MPDEAPDDLMREWHRRTATRDEGIHEAESQLKAELSLVKRQLDQALEQLQKFKNETVELRNAKSMFLAKMNHELRTPLNAISGFAQLLEINEKNTNRRDQLQIINQCSHSLLLMIQDILEFSMINNEKVSCKFRDFDVRSEVIAVVKLFEEQSKAKYLNLTYHISTTVPRHINSGADQLRQIMMNLISNAIKFTQHGNINVYVEMVPCHQNIQLQQLLIEVSDTGVGIQHEHLFDIFEMFEQEDNSYTRRFNGVGLGLSICRQLVTLLGGDIWVESQPAIGSRFFFTVPLNLINKSAESQLIANNLFIDTFTDDQVPTPCPLRCKKSNISIKTGAPITPVGVCIAS